MNMGPFTFDVLRALGFLAAGAVGAAAFYAAGYLRGRTLQQKLSNEVLQTLLEQEQETADRIRQLSDLGTARLELLDRK